MKTRRGVTLLEVLFAIGIASIGILGVMATMLIAGKHAADGARFDAADRVGRNAVRDFHIRGFNRATGQQGTWAAVPVNGQAYCLDPVYVAENGTATPACWFPAFDPAIVPGPRMPRISIRAMPGDQSVAPLPPIGAEFADSIFVARDDLIFMEPTDKTLPPVQHFGSATEARSSTGALSWFATVESNDYSHGSGIANIVVCHRRDLLTTDAERLCNVVEIDASEFKLAARPGQPDSDLDVRDDEWLLLCGVLLNGRTMFRWRRVTSTTDVLPAGQPDYDNTVLPVPSRRVSAAGRDWMIPAANTQVALFGAVVAVYERPVKMEE